MPRTYIPSVHNFVQPVRLYKANDPYYYEVDNIPVRQLEENLLWLKDQLALDNETGTGPIYHGDDIDIENIKQLRPKHGGGRTVTVNAGKFVARINSSMYDRGDYLSWLMTKPGENYEGGIGGILPSVTETLANPTGLWNSDASLYDDIYYSFITEASGSPYRMTGLETLFTVHTGQRMVDPMQGFTSDADTNRGVPEYESVSNRNQWPLLDHANIRELDGDAWTGFSNPTPYQRTWETISELHLNFVQMWRGAVRTSLVDFEGGQIEIAPFSDYDYYYEDANGNDISLSSLAEQRIDLLVVYTHPIDEASSVLPKYTTAQNPAGGNIAASPTSITKPVLGIVRGAGVGLKTPFLPNGNGLLSHIDVKAFGPNTPAPEVPKILANLFDATGTAVNDVLPNQGITDRTGTKVHGSFPSPDDLLNLAPHFATDITSQTDQPIGALGLDTTVGPGRFNDLQHIGQTALPIAYVVVKKCSPDTISIDDIIDIRPFLRTTEMTYNERAGLAAATPPVSFGNPVVGEYQLKRAVEQGVSQVVSRGEQYGLPIYTDVIMGGLAWGPEGVLLAMNEKLGPGSPWDAAVTQNTYVASDDATYDISDLNSSLNFHNHDDALEKRAFLEWIFKEKQVELKSWIGEVTGGGARQYLGLPENRKISLFPEWDFMHEDNEMSDLKAWSEGTVTTPTGYGNATTGRIPQESSKWMFYNFFGYNSGEDQFENTERPCRYASAALDNQFNRTPDGGGTFIHNDIGQDLCVIYHGCKKTIEVVLPDWAHDFEVQAEYTTANPLGNAIANGDQGAHWAATPCGLRVHKRGIVETGGNRIGEFTITSLGGLGGQPRIDGDHGTFRHGIDMQGSPRDQGQGGNVDQGEAPRNDTWANYVVVAPEYPTDITQGWAQLQAGVNTGNGGSLLAASVLRRFARTGLCHYPTIKFTIIGYPHRQTAFENGSAIPSDALYTQDGDFVAGGLPWAGAPPAYNKSRLDLKNNLTT